MRRARTPAPPAAGCGCAETYPQLQPGQVSHGPGCEHAAPAAAPPPDNLHAILERELAGMTPAQRWKVEQAIAWRLHELLEGEALEFLADSPIPYRLVRP